MDDDDAMVDHDAEPHGADMDIDWYTSLLVALPSSYDMLLVFYKFQLDTKAVICSRNLST